jgi:hypothetical protein
MQLDGPAVRSVHLVFDPSEQQVSRALVVRCSPGGDEPPRFLEVGKSRHAAIVHMFYPQLVDCPVALGGALLDQPLVNPPKGPCVAEIRQSSVQFAQLT